MWRSCVASLVESSAVWPSLRGEHRSQCFGRIVKQHKWHAWVLPLAPIHNSAAWKHGGRIFLNRMDVRKGVSLDAGDIVQFFLYVDHRGLGAEDCILLPPVCKPPGIFVQSAKPFHSEKHSRAGGQSVSPNFLFLFDDFETSYAEQDSGSADRAQRMKEDMQSTRKFDQFTFEDDSTASVQSSEEASVASGSTQDFTEWDSAQGTTSPVLKPPPGLPLPPEMVPIPDKLIGTGNESMQ